jgi:hypothetical protein
MWAVVFVGLKEEKGREIALRGGILRRGGAWFVPSQTRPGVKYKVTIHDDKKTCNCPDFQLNGKYCKHIAGVIYHVDYPSTEFVDPTAPTVKKNRRTYPQKWASYNRAQTEEKPLFMRMLAGLCEPLEELDRKGPGRPRLPLCDTAFAACFKIYSRVSARRFHGEIQMAHRAGFLGSEPHFNTVLNALNDPKMTDVLLGFIETTSKPLRDFERTFAADSSGFTSSKYERWLDLKSSALREQHTWTKVHLMCGVDSHIVTAVVIKDKDANDGVQFPELLKQTTQNFQVDEVCADKAYATLPIYAACAEYGVTPYIAFKINNTGLGKGRSGQEHKKPSGKLWQKMYHTFQMHEEEFFTHYHQRSNVETVFSMIKAKFGNEVRSKNETAALNEVLCKIVCHNICVLITMMFEFGIDLDDLIAPKQRKPNFELIHGGLQ